MQNPKIFLSFRVRLRRTRNLFLIHFLQFTIFIVFFTFPTFAQESNWVTVEGSAALENVTKEEARRLAIEDAMRKAVEEVVGVSILAETLTINFRVSGDIVKAVPYGKVIDKEIIEEGVKELREEGKTTPSLIYRVKLRANVIKEKGDLDPYFKIDANLNRNVFKDGDEMMIKVKPTKDCYITIFNILEDEKVLMLIPNRYKKNNFIKANETFTFPDDNDKKKGIRLKIHKVTESKSIVETVYIIALKQPVNFDTAKFIEGIYGIYTAKSAFISDLIREIIEIPPCDRTEKFIQYEIK